MSLSLKNCNDWIFCCRDDCKMKLTFVNSWFSMYFHKYSPSTHWPCEKWRCHSELANAFWLTFFLVFRSSFFNMLVQMCPKYQASTPPPSSWTPFNTFQYYSSKEQNVHNWAEEPIKEISNSVLLSQTLKLKNIRHNYLFLIFYSQAEIWPFSHITDLIWTSPAISWPGS